jgi:Nucleotide modification associated domain 2
MVGDNVYRTDPKTGKWLQEDCVHSQQSGEQDQPNTLHDTGTDRVLISEEFYYFGANAPEVPTKLLDQIGYRNRRGHRVYQKEDCQKLLDWIKAAAGRQANRVLGDPFQFRMRSGEY